MAEDIWQNIPYNLSEESVFQRGWPEAPKEWSQEDISTPILLVRELRVAVNRALEECRNKQQIGSSLESSVRFETSQKPILEAIDFIHENGDNDVDLVRDWLLVSSFQLGGEPWAEILISNQFSMGTFSF